VRLSPELVRNVTITRGAAGRQWLASLPGLIASVAADWQLVAGREFALSFHWVASVTRADGSPAVLKLGPVGALDDQAAALGAYAGRGAVRLLAWDAARGALLLERATPGWRVRSLVPAQDADATAAIAEVARRLHEARPPAGLAPLAQHRQAFADYLRNDPGLLPRSLVGQADGVFAELCESAPEPVLLHGDLHHDNVLAAERSPWLAIDPHGSVGDPAFEAGAALYNPDPRRRDDALLRLVPARLEQLADGLGQPLDRVVAWGFVMAVLSEVWNTEDNPAYTPGRPLDVAQLLLPRVA
jgi:streptomycin 6-kinase